ncbi:fibronectin type III domain-containing protein, partial [Bacillus cereus]|uniref:fibronectin type III domain-containing protein n=1 Tax=Bacillus cereus TaxID=1396 RepID=UPI00114E80A2
FFKTVDKSVSSYKFEGLEANKNYNFKFVALYGDKKTSGIQKGVKTLIDPKTIPPGPVSSLTAEPTYNTVKLKWKSPKDDDLSGFKILQNGKQVAEIGLEEEFTVKNLQPLTDYTFGVISVDKDKNDSPPVSLSVKTLFEKDEEPPLVPSNVFAKPSNGALIASWDKVSDKDLAGYNVYVDDKKVNSNLITSTTFVIKNLENSKKYKIQVQAVDFSKNASALSLPAYGTPDVNTMPIIESNYGVKDVSDGVGTMFGQLWPILAFAVGIPLGFYIIYKLKQVILP